VKVSIRFKGREMAHRELAKSTMEKLRADLEEIAVCEKVPTIDGRQMQMILAPTVEVAKAADDKRKKDQKGKGKKGRKDEVMSSEEDEEEDLEALNAEISSDEDGDDDEEEPSAVDYDIDELGSDDVSRKIGEVGERVRGLKEDGASKEAIAAHVDELLALKARFQELTGEAWAPPA